MKPTKTQIAFAITIILLLVAAGYIINKEIIEPKLLQTNEQYYNQGAIDIYNRLIEELTQCKQIPLLNPQTNQTVNAILVECLEQD